MDKLVNEGKRRRWADRFVFFGLSRKWARRRGEGVTLGVTCDWRFTILSRIRDLAALCASHSHNQQARGVSVSATS
jgi:hypothetical protein